MKKILVIIIVLLQTLFTFGQTKIEQYECMFPTNFVFASKDANGYNVTKNFTVEKATLAYKANKLVSFTLKSSGSAQATYTVEKMISESSRVKQFWIDRSERYFVVISFPLDIDNGMNITFISNINGSVMFDFLFTRILTEREKKEQKILEEQERAERIKEQERKQQEQIKRRKKIESVLSTVNRENIKSKIDSFYNHKLLKESQNWDVTLSQTPQKREITNIVDVLIHTDSLNTDIVKIDENIIDNDLDVFFQAASKYCTIDNIDYYKYKHHIFYKEKINVQTESLEKGVCGVKNRNGNFKYYRITPTKVQEWCQRNIVTNGFHAIEYINYNDQYIIRTITVDKDLEKLIQGKDPRKAKRIWGSIGGAVLLGGLIGLSAL